MANPTVRLRAAVLCDGINCDETGDVLVDLADARVDLNTRSLELDTSRVELPLGWVRFDYTVVCPACAKDGNPHG